MSNNDAKKFQMAMRGKFLKRSNNDTFYKDTWQIFHPSIKGMKFRINILELMMTS